MGVYKNIPLNHPTYTDTSAMYLLRLSVVNETKWDIFSFPLNCNQEVLLLLVSVNYTNNGMYLHTNYVK